MRNSAVGVEGMRFADPREDPRVPGNRRPPLKLVVAPRD
jgi:hypothetical protein